MNCFFLELIKDQPTVLGPVLTWENLIPKKFPKPPKPPKVKTIRVKKGFKSKITWEQVEEIRRLSAEGKTNAELAALFNVYRTTIYRIVNGKRRLKQTLTRPWETLLKQGADLSTRSEKKSPASDNQIANSQPGTEPLPPPVGE